MSFKTRASALLLAVISITPALAVENVWFTGELEHLYSKADGSFLFYLTKVNPDCKASNNNVYLVKADINGVTEEGIGRLYSLVLTAGTTGKQIKFAFDKTDPNCSVNRIRLYF